MFIFGGVNILSQFVCRFPERCLELAERLFF